MATLTLSLPDPLTKWIEAETLAGEYASTSDFMRDLVRREQVRRERSLTLEEFRQRMDESKASGVGDRSIDDIMAEADRIARARGLPLG